MGHNREIPKKKTTKLSVRTESIKKFFFFILLSHRIILNFFLFVRIFYYHSARDYNFTLHQIIEDGMGETIDKVSIFSGCKPFFLVELSRANFFLPKNFFGSFWPIYFLWYGIFFCFVMVCGIARDWIRILLHRIHALGFYVKKRLQKVRRNVIADILCPFLRCWMSRLSSLR